MIDFPAAHSMDTTWFAIDADGCVGIFNSGEGGAVPADLPTVPGAIEFESELVEILISNDGRLIDRGSIDLEFILQSMSQENLLLGIHESEQKAHSDRAANCGLFLLLSTAAVISEIEEQAYKLSFSPIIIELHREKDSIISYTSHCEVGWLKKAIASGLVLAGSKEFDLEYHLNILGWYSYDCHKQYPATYDRENPPTKPIYFKDLPPEISNRMRLINFPNLKFADTSSIQPIEHMPCATWGTEEWKGTDGEWHEEFPDYSHSPTDLI
ncbi:hypothetical protein [Chamaesiphon minutus]|uniref:Uncharacterized protein n=1 Tax=Chamaesiphon minutus (strain ATCC 27169 / PCC 6605) TaxID=1173020 RepID=K9UJE3_CHAP6|nr:hypothetical protein [Chamaesiphon minutus]AFY94581.1 hypothetical protein Cha6605_3595 [Chamaesiphon minutus PCC 6605]